MQLNQPKHLRTINVINLQKLNFNKGPRLSGSRHPKNAPEIILFTCVAERKISFDFDKQVVGEYGMGIKLRLSRTVKY